MHVCVNPKQFLPRLKALAPLVGRRYPSPILETVQFEVTEDGRGVLRATNLDAEAEVEVPLIKVIRPGVVQLPLKPVAKALGDAKTWGVDIEELLPDTLPLNADPKVPSRQVVVQTERSSVTLPTWDPQHFPVLRRDELTQDVKILAWRFRGLLARAQFACDENSTRYALGGCAFEFFGDALHCVATDGRCLAHAFAEATGTGLITPPTTLVGGEERPLAPAVPSRALKALAAILDTRESSPLTVGFTPRGTFQVQARGLHFAAKLLEGRFPPWKEVLPDTSKLDVRVTDPARMLRALKETTRYTTRESRATELRLRGHVLTIVVENDQARITGELIVRNLSEDPDQEASIVIDPLYFLDYLAAETKPFLLAFPPEKGTPLLCWSEGFCFGLMPLEQPEGPKTGVPHVADGPQQAAIEQEPDQDAPPQQEALSA